MTIEIRQLVIRAEVQPDRDASTSQLVGTSPAASPFDVGDHPSFAGVDVRQEELVATCVRIVLRRLERSRER